MKNQRKQRRVVAGAAMKFMTIPEVAKMKGVSRVAVLIAVQTGRIKASRAGRMWLISEEDAGAYSPRTYVRKAPSPGPRPKPVATEEKRRASVKVFDLAASE